MLCRELQLAPDSLERLLVEKTFRWLPPTGFAELTQETIEKALRVQQALLLPTFSDRPALDNALRAVNPVMLTVRIVSARDNCALYMRQLLPPRQL